jgi:leucyl/phenylalanyl-tRNA--protein transferase
LDTQFTTEHLKRFGVSNISRDSYHLRLSEALREMGNFEALPETITGATAIRIVASATASAAMT